MAGIIPRCKMKGVDFCGSRYNYFYIIRSDLGCYMEASNLNKGSDLSIHALHPSCQHGDHYLADYYYFYIIKGDEYRRVSDLSEDTDSEVFTLHPNCRGGDHYLAAFTFRTHASTLTANNMKYHIATFTRYDPYNWYYIIFQEKGICRRTLDLSKDSDSDEFPLHANCRDGLYYWGLPDHYCFLKPASKWGVEFYKGTDFNKYEPTAVYSVHPDILNFLPGGLSITSGPAFGKWVKIKSVINDSPTPVTWQKKVTKKVGYNKEKMSQMTHNWKIEKSGSITSGELAGFISNVQFSFSSEYGGSSVNTERENWNEETEEEEQLSFELKPNNCLYLWQYQLGLGSEPVLFCRDLMITDKPNPPTEVPLPPAQHGLQENTFTLTP